MRFSETKQIYNDAMFSYAVPPLGDCRYCSLDPFTGKVASLVVAIGWSSSDLSSIVLTSIGLASIGLASNSLSSSGLSSSAGTDTGSGYRVPEMVSRLGKYFGQSHHIDWFVPV